jgi:hypothetical protein
VSPTEWHPTRSKTRRKQDDGVLRGADGQCNRSRPIADDIARLAREQVICACSLRSSALRSTIPPHQTPSPGTSAQFKIARPNANEKYALNHLRDRESALDIQWQEAWFLATIGA